MIPIEEVSTPNLVREYAAIHASRQPTTREMHQRLSDVVDELRKRGVLD